MLMRDLQGHLPAGVYQVSWEGEGLVDFQMSDVIGARQLGAGRVSGQWRLAPASAFDCSRSTACCECALASIL